MIPGSKARDNVRPWEIDVKVRRTLVQFVRCINARAEAMEWQRDWMTGSGGECKVLPH